MENEVSSNFIYDFVTEDLEKGVYDHVQTRFPPEPNGYLHIGHAKAICIDFGTAEKYGGKCNLRLDDTNPVKEDVEYVDAIKEDIEWLGFKWDNVYYASDYFDFIYECAIKLIKLGKAYVCDLSPDEIREYRGTLTEPGKNSPYRDRSIEENLDLFERMTKGEFETGSRVLRAKIDMASPNLNMRDPIIYRVLKAHHHRTGDKWCVYPMYDFAHPLSDAKEGVTHSLCSLEFENHRPLYDWFLRELSIPTPPRQIEFARMNLNYTLTSKRKCLRLVKDGIVDGWDDPRMPTLCALRRRGYTPSSIFEFVKRSGISTSLSLCDIGLLEYCIREELGPTVQRRMAVLDPLEIEITNFDEGKTEYFEVSNNPENPEDGTRKVAFTRHLYIEREDFSDNPPPKYQRLKPDCEVRLMGAYIVKCNEILYDENGNVKKLLCTADLETGNGMPTDGRKVKGTIHWVSKETAVDATVNLYDYLFTIEDPGDMAEDKTFRDYLNPDSLKVCPNAKLEGCMKDVAPGMRFQFVRTGYFCADTKNPGTYNRIVTLKGSYKPV